MGLITLLGLCLGILLALIFFPIGVIWSLNTLFLLSIPYTWKTWCAVLLIGMFLNSSAAKS